MSQRTTIDLSNSNIGPLFRRFTNAYGVKNTCSLGVLLIERLTAGQREELIGLVASNAPIETIQKLIWQIERSRVDTLIQLARERKKEKKNRAKVF